MKKLICTALCTVLLTGCVANVIRATPTELRAAPATVLRFDSTRAYDAAYRKTLEQMNSCFNKKAAFSSLQFLVSSDKSADEAQVSWAMSSLLSYRVFGTIVLRPNAPGTKVELYWFSERPPLALQTALQQWLDADATGCPGDAGFNDVLGKQ
jgi:hypothetical protein